MENSITDSTALFAAIDRFLSAPPYYRCLLVVHPEIARLRAASQQVLDHYGWPELPVGKVLSESLLQVAPDRRPHVAARVFGEKVRARPPVPVLCTGVDLLFDPALSLDPLRLLRESSRQATLIVAWPGTFASGVLAYATPPHAHYRTWTRTDLCDYCVVAL